VAKPVHPTHSFVSVRYLAQFSCQNLLHAPTAASFKEAIELAGVNTVDECIVDAMDKW